MNLKLLLFNVQDMFVFMDKHDPKDPAHDLESMREPEWQKISASFYPNKSLEKLYGIKRIIDASNPDVIMIVEVGGRQSLSNFNKHFLDNDYEVFFEPSNSERGIDIGYLCKRECPFNFFLVSHNDDKLDKGRRYARGLLELRALQDGKTKATLLLTHLKSKLDLKKEDHEGRGQRGAEVRGILKTANKIKIKNPKAPLLICGDLNGVIHKEDTEEELQAFAEAGYHDVLEHLDLELPERHTYFYFNKRSDRVPMQLDYILVHENFANLIEKAHVLPMEEDRVPYPPETLKERHKLPSDHFPVFANLRIP